jgi:N-succinyldiaminopimelate aminotransferase
VIDRLDSLLKFHPFTRLNATLEGIAPGGPLLNLAVGEPQAAPPPFVAEILERDKEGWSRYPPSSGTPEFRAAAAAWLQRRYRLQEGFPDRDQEIMPCAGTRQALFHIALAAVPEWRAHGARPAAVLPNPFYHVYAGAAAVAGAEPIFLPATAASGFLPDPDDLTPEVLARTALAYVCSPSNPQGAVASPAYLARWLALARQHDFTVAFDECYGEIYGDDPPAGALEIADGRLDNLIVLHSLSKRSSAPGLRSGFIAGDRRLIRRLTQLVNFGGSAPSFPILAASTALWRDEAHVAMARVRYARCFDIAERLLVGRFGFARPRGGFFLWLDVGDGEAAAHRLWSAAGLRVLPGAFMARADAKGRNRGLRHIRVALVHEPEIVEQGLCRLAEVLEQSPEALPAS